jgi:hypothetical protein
MERKMYSSGDYSSVGPVLVLLLSFTATAKTR